MADDDGPTSPGAPLPSFDTEDGPTLEVHLSEYDETDTIPLHPIDDADDPETVRQPEWPLDEVATTRLEPAHVSIRLEPPPRSEQTRPFELVAPSLPSEPVASLPFPLVTRDADRIATARLPVITGPPLGPPVLPMPYPPPPPPPPRAPDLSSDARTLLTFAASVLATLAVALVIVVAVTIVRRTSSKSSSSHAPLTAQTSEAIPSPLDESGAQAAQTSGCVLAQPGRKLAPNLFASVPLMVAPALSPGQVALGLAESRDSALGLIVDSQELSAERRYTQSFTRAVMRVTPFEHDGSMTFLVDHDDPKLLSARTLPAKTPFVVGATYFGFARAVPNADPETLWPGGKGNAISEPMFASVAGIGYAVVFARGRFSGSAHVGWLSEHGQPRTDLGALELTSYELGAPTVAAGERAIAVALATRDDRGLPWRVLVATAAHGELPRKLEPMSTGMGPDRSDPALVGLAGGAWLLSWIEDASDGHRVRAQVLDASLHRVGAPFDIANQTGIEATRGALFRAGGRVLSFYAVHTDGGSELWCAALSCS